MAIKDRIQHAWNAFRGADQRETMNIGFGSSTSSPSHKIVKSRFSPTSIASTVFNQIAVDASMVDLFHVKINPKNQNETKMESGIQNILTVEANIDQSNREFMHDLVFSMFDEGVIAVVPVETTINPSSSGSYEINTMRVGRITQWYPQHVRVNLYNEATGNSEEILVPKATTAIIENPLYEILSGPNSTLKRLVSKMALLDFNDQVKVDQAGKLDLIIQLPYAIKTEARKIEANNRLEAFKEQLTNNKYGIAYTDATEKFTQLNRSLGPDDLATQVADLTKQLYNQLGMSESVFNGTASEAEMRTYYNRTIDPILARIIAEFKRKFLTKTARTQGQTFTYRRDVFKLVPVEQLADIADKFSRNEILSSNEIRAIIGFGPSDNPRADELHNPNIADKNQTNSGSLTPPENIQNE